MDAPLTAQVELTDRCNLRCRHCYHLDTGEKICSQDLSDEQTLSLVDKVIAAKVFSIVLTGGEPLIRSKLLVKAVEKIKQADIDVSVNTNLLLLTPNLLAKLARVDAFLVSCPSTDQDLYCQMTGGNLKIFLRKLKLLSDSGVRFSANMVVNQSNLHHIRQTAEALASYGVKSFGATPMGANLLCPKPESMLNLDQFQNILLPDLIWAQENLGLKVDIFEALPKCAFPLWMFQEPFGFMRRKCQAGKTTCAVSNVGEVRPCTHNIDSFGNIFQENFSGVWSKITKNFARTNMPRLCQKCGTVKNCEGGCRITAQAASGRKNGRDPLMDKPINPGAGEKKKIVLSPETLFQISNLRIRKETNGSYIITNKRFHRNAMAANEQLTDFLRQMSGQKALPLKTVAENCQTSFDNPAFQQVIRNLFAAEFAERR